MTESKATSAESKASEQLSSAAKLFVRINECEDLPKSDFDGPGDPYVVVSVPGHKERKTRVVRHSYDSQYFETFEFALDESNAKALAEGHLTLRIMDKDLLYDDEYGVVKLAGKDILAAEKGSFTKHKLSIPVKDKKCKSSISFETKVDAAAAKS